jgi:acetyltransferase-like isoleucine patch superfamily enzyme
MSNFIKKLRKLFQHIACAFPLELIDKAIDKRKLAIIRKRLKYCGHGVILSQNLVVQRPEMLHLSNNVSLGANISILDIGGVKIGSNTMIAIGVTIIPPNMIQWRQL